MNARRRLACAAGLSLLIGDSTGCGDEGPILVAAVTGPDDFLYTVLGLQPMARIDDRVAGDLPMHSRCDRRVAGRASPSPKATAPGSPTPAP